MKKPEVIGPEASVKDAAELMTRLDIGSLVVVKNGNVVGIITDGDILRRFVMTDKPSSNVRIKEIMTQRIIKIGPNEKVEVAAALMSKKNIKHLPIIEKNKLVGMLTASDIMKHAIEIGMDAFF